MRPLSMIGKKAGLILLGTLFILSITLADTAKSSPIPSRKFKILHIMSYHSPWEWTDTMYAGFKDALKDVNVEYKVFQMDAKRNSAPTWQNKVGKEARELIDSWKPDLVYTTDDDVQQYVVKYYINTKTPFVFAAINADPGDYGFTGSKNVTGVLEIEHFVESVKLLKQVVPKTVKIAVVIDDGPMWEPVVKRMKDKLPQLSEVKFVSWDKILTFAAYKQKMKEYSSTVDAVALLGIFSFKDAKGQNVPYQDVLKWTAENSKLPDFSFWKDRVSFGTLCAVSVSGYEQGLAAGKMARGILVEGRAPASYPVQATTKGEPLVSLARANQLGIKVRSGVLLSVKVVKQFEWEK